MRLLVTGGAGMLGRRVVRQWREAGGDVAVLDNLSSGLSMPPEASLAVVGDLCDAKTVADLLASWRPDAILHLAAVHHIPTCEMQRAHCLDVNVVGTERLLAAAESAQISRLVIASSGAVYAWQEGPLSELSSPLAPCDNYALSKSCNEQQLKFWSARGAHIGRVARIFNAVGHDDPNAHLIPEVLKQLRQSSDGCIRLGNLAPRRDYLHADDIARGLIAMLHDPRTDIPFDVFNLCSGWSIPSSNWCGNLAKSSGCRSRLRWIRPASGVSIVPASWVTPVALWSCLAGSRVWHSPRRCARSCSRTGCCETRLGIPAR